MLTDSDLEALLGDVESDWVERKEGLSDKSKVRQAICAFANDLAGHGKPGVLFIGARDDGSCVGLEINDQLLLTLSHMRDDGTILPFPSMAVEKRTLNGCEMAVVIVEPSDTPPVKVDGCVWVRVGPRRGKATPQDEARLMAKRQWGNLPFDRQLATPASMDDLDLRLFQSEYLPSAVAPDVLEANQRSADHQFSALGFVARNGSPNNAAVVVFGTDPRAFLPGAYIQFVRFDGDEMTAPIKNQKELSGPLSQMLFQLDEVLAANISVAANLDGPREIRTPDYPLSALQQLTRNAVMHRIYESTNAPVRLNWFSDRIELSNPGGLFGVVNEENFGKPGVTDYRNPLIAEAMKNLGYVQRFGMGIALARAELEKNGNPPPEFEFTPHSVLVTVRTHS